MKFFKIEICPNIQFFEVSWRFLRLEGVNLDKHFPLIPWENVHFPYLAMFFTCPFQKCDIPTHLKILFLNITKIQLLLPQSLCRQFEIRSF